VTTAKEAERSSISVDGTTIYYQVRRSRRRRKTIEIALDPRAGAVVSVPFRATQRDITDALRKRAGWILKRAGSIALQPLPLQLIDGALLPYLGGRIPLIVRPTETERIRLHFEDGHLTAAVPDGLAEEEHRQLLARSLERWFRQRAAERLEERVRWWARAIGRTPKQVVVRDQRRRWGSCSTDGVIRFNWRLIQLDLDLIDYVVVHELAHLLERNHGPAFWQLVARALPDYEARRKALGEAGASIVL
jgi:predicted metal-dependent hydrolase